MDRWNKRSIGGMTYYVSHPGGRTYDTFPVNSNEAESRRGNRFWDFNHTQGELEFVSESIVKRSLSDLNGAKRAVISKDKEEKVFLIPGNNTKCGISAYFRSKTKVGKAVDADF